MKGELHPTKNRFMRRTFLHVDDSVEFIGLFSGVATSRDSNGCTMYLPRGRLSAYQSRHYVIRSFPFGGGGALLNRGASTQPFFYNIIRCKTINRVMSWDSFVSWFCFSSVLTLGEREREKEKNSSSSE